MAKSADRSIMGTRRRIRLGIWGLGRGMHFYQTLRNLNLDPVAGCDYNEHMRAGFLKSNPGAFVTDNAEEFLEQDFDAVLLATFCPAHAEDAIRCLEAGKHVLSEVTAFHTMEEGVRLVEAVEKTGLVYNMAENYPFQKANLYLAQKWREGLFGELMYAEYEYVHECRMLCYTYIDGKPVEPGWTVHHWRSWQNYHYYNTHSLGPVMHITGLRPTRVVSLPGTVRLPGYVGSGLNSMGGIAPSLITLSNGALMRNLMGSTTNDTHQQRLWGTRGAAELGHDLHLRLGGAGCAPAQTVNPRWPRLGELADKMGHGGSDFWVLYEFARHLLFGEPAFFDIYRAVDCTLPGILAYRSAKENGKAYDVPDFRRKKDRDRWRHDRFAQPRYDTHDGVFPAGADGKVTARFTSVMKQTISDAQLSRSVQDWLSVADDAADPRKIVGLARDFLARRPAMARTVREARRIIRAAPRSDGARVLQEMLDLGDLSRALRPAFAKEVAARIRQAARRPAGAARRS